MPRYRHDCTGCVYLGEDRPRHSKEEGHYVDVYYHRGWREGIGYYSRRWGHKRGEYIAVEEARAEGPLWDGLVKTAKAKGLVK